jgi:hypothetical protein
MVILSKTKNEFKEKNMKASIVSRSDKTVTIQVEIPLSRSMLDSEESILQAVNHVGNLATEEALKQFDTDGSPIYIADLKWYPKGHLPKTYQTPYGELSVNRYVYQRGGGGATFCPLEQDARIIVTSTPRFAKMISRKYASMPASQVLPDLKESNGRVTTRCLVQDLSEAVAVIVQAKEEHWSYQTPQIDEKITTIGIGVDGASLFVCKEGLRQAMAGTIALYDKEGARHHTIYIGATPEYGKATFYEKMEGEVEQVKKLYPKAKYIGIADGAKDNWPFLEKHCNELVLDFYHATEYLTKVAEMLYPEEKEKKEEFLEVRCHELKHESGAPLKLLEEMKRMRGSLGKAEKKAENPLEVSITYFENNHQLMKYAAHVEKKWPIGSGVTEAACKTLIKQRFCGSGMQWKTEGASMVLSLRTLVLTEGRWEQFWSKVNQFGFPVAA